MRKRVQPELTDSLPDDRTGSLPGIDGMDQARRTIILFLVVTMAASALTAGKRLRAIPDPAFLTHGSQCANVEPGMITCLGSRRADARPPDGVRGLSIFPDSEQIYVSVLRIAC